MFQTKLQKYNAKVEELKKTLGMYSLLENDILFRSAPNICDISNLEKMRLNTRECSDTGKSGLYFGNDILLSIAMNLEYDTIMELGVFIVTNNFNPLYGKYSYRNINRNRYYDKAGNLVTGVNLNYSENISHVQCNIFPLDKNKNHLLPDKFAENYDGCEIFLTEKDLQNIQPVEFFIFNNKKIKNADDLYKYLVSNKYPRTLKKYIDDEILVIKQC
jgi:hypothetical protein